MPFVTVDDTRLYYRLDGSDSRPVLMLAHSIGTDHGLWDPQLADLAAHFRVLRYDSRGHGASSVPAGDSTMERLGRDALGLADALGIETFAFCGLSLGGMVGQWLGAKAADRLTRLVLANTSARFPDPAFWNERLRMVAARGMSAVAEGQLRRWVSAGTADSAIRTLLSTDPAGYAACGAAIRDMDHTRLLRDIRVPTLIVVGDLDAATPWAGHGEVLAREIPVARVVRLPAAHLSNVECPRAFTAALLEFLLPAVAGDPLEAGYSARRAVLGDEYVDRAIARTSEFTRAFQELITRYAWGTVWSRPGLDVRTRRLLVLAITAALGRWEEYRLHLRAGLAHGLEPCDVKEALLQTAIYAGAPAANTAFQIAVEEQECARKSG